MLALLPAFLFNQNFRLSLVEYYLSRGAILLLKGGRWAIELIFRTLAQ